MRTVSFRGREITNPLLTIIVTIVVVFIVVMALLIAIPLMLILDKPLKFMGFKGCFRSTGNGQFKACLDKEAFQRA